MPLASKLPVITTAVMDQLWDDSTPTHKVISDFEAEQPNVASAVYFRMKNSDEALAVVRDMALMYQALKLEIKKNNEPLFD